MKGNIVKLSPYAAHLLMGFLDSGERRPLDEVRRLRRLMAYLVEQQGEYYTQFEDVAFKTRQAREAVSIIPQHVWVAEMSRINGVENAALAALNDQFPDDITLTLSETDLAAMRKWWREVPTFPSGGIVGDTVLLIDDALTGAEEVEMEGVESQSQPQRPALPHISEMRRKKARR